MIILTKRQADAAIVASVFQPGGSLAGIRKIRFDLGKYKPGSMAGREIPPTDRPPRLVWVERRRDRDGAFDALFCIPAQEGGSK